MATWWKVINTYRGRSNNIVSEKISGKDWTKHFSALLNCNTREEYLETDTGVKDSQIIKDEALDAEFSMLELKRILGTLKNSKAAGEDIEIMAKITTYKISWITITLTLTLKTGIFHRCPARPSRGCSTRCLLDSHGTLSTSRRPLDL
ncbi:hypothetical protein KQX54_000135 [Cotesia glomerata]|uniref:Uncharacterized protein n=1 Tax=Cotesia glomerata TaxID=32391 RepID=A0AAV7HZY0_COTGL|nr:hypothetical protein KQX54_000135 [Cotesia glomerata]